MFNADNQIQVNVLSKNSSWNFFSLECKIIVLIELCDLNFYTFDCTRRGNRSVSFILILIEYLGR